jgi:hypothetical protein
MVHFVNCMPLVSKASSSLRLIHVNEETFRQEPSHPPHSSGATRWPESHSQHIYSKLSRALGSISSMNFRLSIHRPVTNLIFTEAMSLCRARLRPRHTFLSAFVRVQPSSPIHPRRYSFKPPFHHAFIAIVDAQNGQARFLLDNGGRQKVGPCGEDCVGFNLSRTCGISSSKLANSI